MRVGEEEGFRESWVLPCLGAACTPAQGPPRKEVGAVGAAAPSRFLRGNHVALRVT